MASIFPSPPPWHADAADPVAPPSYPATSFLPSLLIIAALLAFVLLASVSIHTFLRFLSRSSPSPTLPRTHRDEAPAGTGGDPVAEGDGKQRQLIESLPRFTMASALAALPKSSPDCAVCLSPFTPDAELRLLPACRHAFHAACVDAWLRTTPTCPLCRATVALPHPSISAILAAEQPPPPEPPRSRDRFRVQMGSVSNRGSPTTAAAGGGDSRTYSLGSFDYHIEEEVEAVVSRLARAVARSSDTNTVKEEKPAAAQGSPLPPGETVAEAAGTPSRGWLREYVDRLASSAASLAFSGRWSSRWSQSQQGHRNEEPWLWDTEAAAMPLPAPGSDEEETAFMVLYRWIAAV